jgi:rhamnosyltransferase
LTDSACRRRYRVAAVIVTFHPAGDALSALLRRLEGHTDATVVIDNTPIKGLLQKMIVASTPVELIENESNVGLAAAQNQGIRWALERDFTHILLLDQDSLPEPGCIAQLCKAARNLEMSGISVGAVGPRIVDARTGRSYSFKKFSMGGSSHQYCSSDSDVVEADFLIASGTLIPIESLQVTGLMDAELFIDRIDIDWCLRSVAAGRKVYGICGARMRHQPGDRSARIWIGRWTETAVHSPERTYYMIRNSILLYRRPYAPLRWIVKDVVWLLGVVLITCAIAPARLRRLGLVFKGIVHGLQSVRGPLGEDNLAATPPA